MPLFVGFFVHRWRGRYAVRDAARAGDRASRRCVARFTEPTGPCLELQPWCRPCRASDTGRCLGDPCSPVVSARNRRPRSRVFGIVRRRHLVLERGAGDLLAVDEDLRAATATVSARPRSTSFATFDRGRRPSRARARAPARPSPRRCRRRGDGGRAARTRSGLRRLLRRGPSFTVGCSAAGPSSVPRRPSSSVGRRRPERGLALVDADAEQQAAEHADREAGGDDDRHRLRRPALDRPRRHHLRLQLLRGGLMPGIMPGGMLHLGGMNPLGLSGHVMPLVRTSRQRLRPPASGWTHGIMSTLGTSRGCALRGRRRRLVLILEGRTRRP